ncbi:MAG: FAD-dependent oxidoreductase [Gemmatimonadales bacterium]|nr:FAD-dependent oxidoreductase [Gemmatimonadales bacterium]NIN10116.1 FAD-dependent oxidoreductase [Gemmatimonadales bacterium]NIR02600.1 FAD-dependent oxidoreductase [Gemmatimonadales bacterium]NIS66294.1 FAD-dependent oxidoreductase [Gemmatimonadales bacterium]
MPDLPRVVIVGGGFGGLQVVKQLRRAPVEVTLIDRRNIHLFQPLLYQVATGGLSPGDISSPLRWVLRRHRNTRVWLAEVSDIDGRARRVVLKDGQLAYDTLVLATGAEHHYFGRDDWAQRAPGLKTIEDATDIRRRILLAFEAAEREPDPKAREEFLTFVVVGAGPTGVELAGAMGELARDTLRHDFRAIDTTATRILLLEGRDRVLSPFPTRLSHKCRRSLEQLGVTVRTGALVAEVGERWVLVKRGEETERIPTRTVLWAAGVRASHLGRVIAETTGAQLDDTGRVLVEPDLSLPGHSEIFVIGDLAHFAHQTGGPLPGLAAVAMQQGRYVGKAIRKRLRGQEVEPFRYRNMGQLATIGRAAAVADLPGIRISGFLAWILWLFVHLMYLVGFENRVLVFIQWAWNYFTWDRGTRIITGKHELGPGD